MAKLDCKTAVRIARVRAESLGVSVTVWRCDTDYGIAVEGNGWPLEWEDPSFLPLAVATYTPSGKEILA